MSSAWRIAVVLFLASICYSSAAHETHPRNNVRPNILVVLSDNQSPSLIGAYGNTEITTPNIDRLASEGVVFEQAFATSGVCSPTRASLLTGLMPSQHGVHNALPTDPVRIEISDWSAVEEFRTLPQTLSAAGYRTALIGKYHLGTHDKAQLGFDHWVTMETGHTKSFINTSVINNGEKIHISDHITDYWTDEAIKFLERSDKNQPFFLLVAYNGPYMLPPVVTAPSHSRFAEKYLSTPPSFPQLPVHEYLRNWAIDSKPNEQMRAESTHAWAAINALNNPRSIINTAAETSHVDAGVGRLLQSLKDLGIDENTLVIYTSDQGSAYGQHGLWGNTSWAYPFPAFESHLAIPLIIRQPGVIPEGRRTEILASQVDLFPTILDHAGLSDISIDGATGQSLIPAASGNSVETSRPVFFEFITYRGMRTNKWKFVKRFPDGELELYDVILDSDELNNLADDPEFAALVARLSKELDEFFDAAANPAYDLWNGGTGKGRLIGDYGKNDIFESRFPGWRPPFIEKTEPFED